MRPADPLASKTSARRQWLFYGLTVLIFLSSLIAPRFLRDQFLQHLPTVVTFAWLAMSIRRRRLDDGSLVCVLAFLALHCVAARHAYTLTPYDDWTEWAFGWRLNEVMGFERNHFDRLVHFVFGALVVWPVGQLLVRGGTAWQRFLGTQGFVWGISGLYEVFEWGLTVVMADPHMVERYNGQQGDPFDAQKDMGLAGLGAALVTPFLWKLWNRAAPRGVAAG